LLKQPKQVWLTAFLDELAAGQTIEIHSLYCNCLSSRRNAKEGATMRAAHSEACGHSVVFGNHLFKRPLNIGEAASHHPNNCKVASRAAQRLGMFGNMEYRVRRDKLFSEPLAASVDELHKTAHCGFVDFCCHSEYVLSLCHGSLARDILAVIHTPTEPIKRSLCIGDRNMSNVWFITGAGRGMGVDIAKAALAAGYRVVATGRNTDKVAEALGKSANLLIGKLDITNPADAESAVKAAVDKFGRIDVLVNNAANFYAGFFEELTPEQMERQLATSLIGPMNVTRAVLPVMRKQRSGLIITISSTAGLIGFEFGTAYAASKFGLEGWMQSLQAEIEPFGIDTLTVNPGFFRTELLTEESTKFSERTIEDFNESRAKQMEFWKGYNGQQSGDPAKLAQALITISSKEKPPRRFIAGADAVGTADKVAATLQQQTDAYRELSSSLAYDKA
jgi:NAD(P)-dependent dehydrogenase (short-subunit alcohol dehydrogenase family)